MADAPDIRASDLDRERAADLLRRHFAEGRITVDELDHRLGQVYASRTLGDLNAPAGPFHDLPALAPRPPEQVSHQWGPAPEHHRVTGMREHLTVYVLVNAFLIVIWLLTGAGYFWPIWPMVGWGFGVAAHALGVYLPARLR